MDPTPIPPPGGGGAVGDSNGGKQTSSPNWPAGLSRKRSTSSGMNGGGGGGGLLSRIPFIRSSGDHHHRPRSRHSNDQLRENVPILGSPSPPKSVPAIPAAVPELRAESYPSKQPPIAQSALTHQYQQQQQQQQQEQQQQQQQQSSLSQSQQQQKTRRRRGSLRKVALLSRGAQRERREQRAALSIDTRFQGESQGVGVGRVGGAITSSPGAIGEPDRGIPAGLNEGEAYGLGISDITPRPSMDGYASRSAAVHVEDATPTAVTAPISIPRAGTNSSMDGTGTESTVTSPTISYSTTDDEDGGGLHMASTVSRPSTTSASSSSLSLLRPERASLSSGSEGYFPTLMPHAHPRPLGLGGSGGTSISGQGGPINGVSGSGVPVGSIQRRRSATQQRAKSPLALTSLALSTTPLSGTGPSLDADHWDYAETEFWGWVVLVVTWVVFVTGMGSCLGVWSWAWDVGTTPSAPPELSDDHTLPIVGYYPALMILTCVMAWVWVVVAWVGMKFFRHARVNGD